MIGAPHQVRQFLHVMRQRRPLGHRAIDVGGAEHRPHILPRQRQPAGDDKQRHVLGIGLRDAGKGIFDARSGLGGEHAILLAALDARIAVGDADADALLPAQDRADVDCRAGLDHRIARIAGEEFGALALENFGNDLRRHSWRSLPVPDVYGAIIGPIRSAAPCTSRRGSVPRCIPSRPAFGYDPSVPVERAQ